MTMTILETFELQESFPGLSNLLMSVNKMLDTGFYHVKIPFDSDNSKLLQITVYGKKSSRPTVSLKFPLVEDISDTRIYRVTELFSALNQKRSTASNFTPMNLFFTTDDEKSINFVANDYSDSFVEYKSNIEPGKVVNQHTFELRKFSPGISNVLSSISLLLNEHKYTAICSMDTNRWLQLQVFYKDRVRATLIFSRHLKSVRKEDALELTKLNFAWAYHAPVEFESLDNETITATVCEPENFAELNSLLTSYSLLDKS